VWSALLEEGFIVTLLNEFATAIHVRQAERMGCGEQAMIEMWVPRETYDSLCFDAKRFHSMIIMGVIIRPIGQPSDG
jgi:hypothetical protein